VQAAVLAAIVTSSASIVVAVTSAGLTYASQRRAYEYDARKRLYAVTEPLLSQLSERAGEQRAGVLGLARTARNGNLGSGRNWLTKDPYYLHSTGCYELY
jgi:hypothetical protein